MTKGKLASLGSILTDAYTVATCPVNVRSSLRLLIVASSAAEGGVEKTSSTLTCLVSDNDLLCTKVRSVGSAFHSNVTLLSKKALAGTI